MRCLTRQFHTGRKCSTAIPRTKSISKNSLVGAAVRWSQIGTKSVANCASQVTKAFTNLLLSLDTFKKENTLPVRNGTPRILHVVLSLEYGGMEQVVVDLVRLSAEAGQHAEVLCLERPGELAEQVMSQGTTVHCLNKRRGLRLGLRRKIAQLLEHIRPDIVHTHQIGTLFYAGPPAVCQGVGGILHTEHGKEYNTRRRTRWLALRREICRAFLLLSEDTAQHVIQHKIVAKDKIKVVYNGINIDRFLEAARFRDDLRIELGIPQNSIVIGTVGRLSEIKRQDVLIQAFALLKLDHLDPRLIIVGDGPQRRALSELVGNLGISSRVHFMGFRPAVKDILPPWIYLHLQAIQGNATGVIGSLGGGIAGCRYGSRRIARTGHRKRNWQARIPRRCGRFIERANGVSHRSIPSPTTECPWPTVALSRFDRRTMAMEYDNLYRKLLHMS